MLDMWMEICGSDERRMRELDPDTIQALQGMAPGACRSDYAYLWEELKDGQLLGNFTEQARAEMWSQICSVSQHTSILSLHTFFEDLKFLKGAADSLKRLLRLEYRDTIKGHLESIYRDEGSGQQMCVLQLSDCEYKVLQGPSAARFELAYRQLWLAAFRVYQDLPAEPQKKHILARPRKRADEVALFRLADVASRLGFTPEPIRNILLQSPTRQIAKAALLAVIKSGQHVYKDLEREIDLVTGVFNSAEIAPIGETSSYSNNISNVENPARWGLPHDSDHERDRQSLFLTALHREVNEPFLSMTSIFIRRAVYFAFFGRVMCPGVHFQDFVETTNQVDCFMAETASAAEQPECNNAGRLEEQEGQSLSQDNVEDRESTLWSLSRAVDEKKMAIVSLLTGQSTEELEPGYTTGDGHKSFDSQALLEQEVFTLEHIRSLLEQRQETLGKLNESVQSKLAEMKDLELQHGKSRRLQREEESKLIKLQASVKEQQGEVIRLDKQKKAQIKHFEKKINNSQSRLDMLKVSAQQQEEESRRQENDRREVW